MTHCRFLLSRGHQAASLLRLCSLIMYCLIVFFVPRSTKTACAPECQCFNKTIVNEEESRAYEQCLTVDS